VIKFKFWVTNKCNQVVDSNRKEKQECSIIVDVSVKKLQQEIGYPEFPSKKVSP